MGNLKGGGRLSHTYEGGGTTPLVYHASKREAWQVKHAEESLSTGRAKSKHTGRRGINDSGGGGGVRNLRGLILLVYPLTKTNPQADGTGGGVERKKRGEIKMIHTHGEFRIQVLLNNNEKNQ